MKMKWQQSELLFQVYNKEGQQLKYVDKQSTHRPSTFRSITSRVFKRISQLTSKSESMKWVRIDKVFPGHAEALSKAGLGEQQFPTFGEVWSKEELVESRAKKKKWHKKGNVYL
eukprot:14659667-Ditylum_brightwellii.AAC.1